MTACRRMVLCGVLLCLVSLAGPAEEAARPLLRFPDIHDHQVVFTHGEDIWTAPLEGGRALRLTDAAGEERHPKFSPDGAMIAFTGEIDGNHDVYVMDADGANVRRLTFHPDMDEVVGWHPTRNMVMFRSARLSGARYERLFLVSPEGGSPEVLPLHEAGRGSFSADGELLAYTRIAREDRTWKRYKGGMAQDIWLHDMRTGEDRRLTDYDGTDRLPMFVAGDIYFVSDRDGTLQLYRYHMDAGTVEQVTHHEDFDVRRASAGGRLIVYELGGDLWTFDTGGGETAEIPISIPVPPRESRPYRLEVREQLRSVSCAPGGGRVAVVARGELFTVPREEGRTRNLSTSSGSRERGAVWSPDGAQIAYLSDADGELDIWLMDGEGRTPARRLTDLGPGYRHTLRWSPDGSMIAFADQTLSLKILVLDSGEVLRVDRSPVEPMDVSLDAKPISDMAWSPDSRWLAYSKIQEDKVSRLFIYSLDEKLSRCASGDLFNDFGPAFSADGRHLFFVSNRRFDPTFGDFEWQLVYKKVAGIYALTLRAGDARLLPLASDESVVAEPHVSAEDTPPRVVIDFAELAERVEALPLPAGNYRQLAATGKALLYLDADEGDFNRFEFREVEAMDLKAFDLAEKKEHTLATAINSYSLSPDGTYLAYRRAENVGLIELEKQLAAAHFATKATPEEKLLDLQGLVMVLDPRAEWLQIYDEAWRMERDFFYDPAMHGLDWQALGDKYRGLAERATCRQDLRFAIGELIGELATSHTYAWPSANRHEPDAVSVGMLGADWELDAASGSYRIARRLEVPDFSRGIEPPLVAAGVAEGEYLISVNGTPVDSSQPVYAAFQGLAGQTVELEVSPTPDKAAARTVLVRPLASERWLRYHDWVEHNRQVVAEASGGRIGYIHLPDTYMGSALEFPKTYYSQTTKEGLIIDGRYNGGGLDPEIFLSRLAKKPLAYWTRRYSSDQVTPTLVSDAHMVCLTNRQAGSGGDELPHEFQQMGLGPVIGTRTWGGLVGVSMSIPMVDGSGITAPDYRIYTPEGEWTVENHGVDPDIVVENSPAEMARGWDAQLQKGIEVLLAKIEAEPRTKPEHPPFPRP